MNTYHEPWTESASCRSVSGDFWFPEVGEPTAFQARRICGECPVLADCREWVMGVELGQGPKARYGIVAAMSPIQRWKFEPQWLEGAA